MEKIWKKYKWVFLILINAFPFVLKIILYSMGAMFDLSLFLPIFAGLTVLNYMIYFPLHHFV